jgi:preprotein translocase subunit SecF
MDLMKPAKYFFALSAAAMLVSLVLLVYPGPRLSIEFTGGTRIELKAEADVSQTAMADALKSFPEELSATVNKTQDGTFIVRMKTIDQETNQTLLKHLNDTIGAVEETRYTTIGPTVGATLKKQALWALLTAGICIILYVAWSFRRIPRKLSPWKFGLVVVITLIHDVLITTGIFVILSHVTSFEVDTLFTTAILTIFGYSVNDTIIIFDRIRENLQHQDRNEEFAVVANRSLIQSITRSLYTSTSVQIMLISLLIFGSGSIRWFVLALIIGIGLGTYSSIFVATPLLVYWRKRQ